MKSQSQIGKSSKESAECTLCGSRDGVEEIIPGVSALCKECLEILRDCCKRTGGSGDEKMEQDK